MKNKLLKLCLATGIVLGLCSSAYAHLVSFGWKDNGNGTVSLWGEHWHGNLTSPYTDNGGITISGSGFSPYTVQWTSVLNNLNRDTAVANGTITGYDTNTGNGGSHGDWLITDNLVIGNGTYNFFTGPNCCIDTMSFPVSITLTGITSVDPGTGPGAVPDAGASIALLVLGLGSLAGMRGARKAKA